MALQNGFPWVLILALFSCFFCIGNAQHVNASHFLQAELLASNGEADDYFGFSVATSGSVVVIGAYNKNNEQGEAYVFSCASPPSCTQNTILTDNDGDKKWFGFSVGISRSLVVVGAPFKMVGSNDNQGAVYVFSCPSATSCTQGSQITVSDGAAHDNLGAHVAISGSLVVVRPMSSRARLRRRAVRD